MRACSNGASLEASGSRVRIARTQTRAASTITMMISAANSAARTPSTVELVTTLCMSAGDLAGGSTSPASIADWNLSRWAKKPSFGSSENTFW